MSKYDPLWKYIQSNCSKSFKLTYAEIEGCESCSQRDKTNKICGHVPEYSENGQNCRPVPKNADINNDELYNKKLQKNIGKAMIEWFSNKRK